MTYLLLTLASAALLVIGIVGNDQTLVVIALGLSAAAAALVVVVHLVPAWLEARAVSANATGDAELDPASDPVPASAASRLEPEGEHADDSALVVFIVGRTTFHDETCALVNGKQSSRAVRRELEAGGMSACRRCL